MQRPTLISTLAGIALAFFSTIIIAPTAAQPIGRTLNIETYASVPDPMTLSFAPDGTLYVGRDLAGSGGSAADPTTIHRVLNDGTVEPFGPAISDPDAVLFDAAGHIALLPNSVIVAGVDQRTLRGAIHAIAPDGTTTTITGPSTAFFNPSDLVLTNDNRLILTDFNRNDVKATMGSTPTSLYDLASPGSISYNPNTDTLYASSATGRIDIHQADGSLIESNFANTNGRASLAVGPDNDRFAQDLYAMTTAGDLWRIRADGTTTVIASGFAQVEDLAFAPDGTLFVSEFATDRILRITGAPFLLGDMDGNGVVDAFDVDDMELALADRPAYDALYPHIDADVVGDIDPTTLLDAFDVSPFEVLLASTGNITIPSPTTISLLSLSALFALMRRSQQSIRHDRSVSHGGHPREFFQ